MPMTRDELEARYRCYIAALNERRLADGEMFYADTLSYNGTRIGRAEWRQTAIEDSFDATADLSASKATLTHLWPFACEVAFSESGHPFRFGSVTKLLQRPRR